MPDNWSAWKRDTTPALLTFAVLVLIVLSGLLPFAMILGIPSAGVVETGQAVPARWWVGILVGLAALAILLWRRSGRDRLWWLGVAAIGAMVMIVTLCQAAVGSAAQGGAEHAVGNRSPAAVVTALPLFWTEDPIADFSVGAPTDRQAFVHASRHRLVPLDQLNGAALSGVDRLLLVQPRALAPQELVALDHWVRAGGRLVILADPLLLWPSAFPLGDRRRPPLTSLLDPLLAHWGLRLEPATMAGEPVQRRRLPGGAVLMVAGASRFARTGTLCNLAEGALLASCRIGGGQVRLIADADMIDDRLWLADARHPREPAATAADTVAVIDHWLDAPLGDAPPRRNRIRDEASLRSGLRAALVVGIVWVGLGFALKRVGKSWRMREK
ncbi:Gldg family protein [Sphingobium subterraneum]|uniref:ABC-type uncharacterized transport system domain-containing protein n=1 Tax=Sphingobium subterraneum TaxID=627688 RepID=A0A841IZP6_9SPHN|nr:hypothetical protein [Sphingobium subterraneum]MBB6123592.1 hypothetical protein [Sphingobium subterraneum]